MPLSYRLDLEDRIVIITGDYAEPAEWRVMLGRVAGDPDYSPGFGFLRDLRASEHPVTAGSVVGIMSVVREFWSALAPRRVAIVTRREVDFPAMMAHALAQEGALPMRAFSSWRVTGRQGRSNALRCLAQTCVTVPPPRGAIARRPDRCAIG
jgi:hypothetical protein